MPAQHSPKRSQSATGKAALRWARLGFKVFPCKPDPDDKKPLTKNGFYDATTDEAQIEAWWRQYPNAWIGVRTGERIDVVDLDKEDGGLKTLPDWRKRSPVIARTVHGGAHLYYAASGIGCTKDALGKGVDTRGTGGYVIVPPSPGYTWINGHDLSALPPVPDDLRPGRAARKAKDRSPSGLFAKRVRAIAPGKTLDQIKARILKNPLRFSSINKETGEMSGAVRYIAEGRLDEQIEIVCALEPAIKLRRTRKASSASSSKNYLTPAQWIERKIEPADRLLGDLFTTTSRTLFIADTGIGKTMLGMTFACAMALGRGFLHWAAGRAARVLYIDGEMPRELMQERISLMCDLFDVEPSELSNLHVLSTEDADIPELDSPEGQKWLDKFIKDQGGYDFIVFDNLMSLCGGSMMEEDSWKQEMLPYSKKLSKERIGQLWLHHTGHDKTRSYGPKMREWTLDTVMVGEEPSKADHISFNLKFSKKRRRTPKNYGNFEDVHVELRDGAWSGGAVRDKPSPAIDVALQVLRRLVEQEGEGVSMRVWRQATVEQVALSRSRKIETRYRAFTRAAEKLIEGGEVVKNRGKYAPA